MYKRQGKARLNSYDKLLNEDLKEKEEKLEIFIPNGPRLGNKVIEAKHVAKAYGEDVYKRQCQRSQLLSGFK